MSVGVTNNNHAILLDFKQNILQGCNLSITPDWCLQLEMRQCEKVSGALSGNVLLMKVSLFRGRTTMLLQALQPVSVPS